MILPDDLIERVWHGQEITDPAEQAEVSRQLDDPKSELSERFRQHAADVDKTCHPDGKFRLDYLSRSFHGMIRRVVEFETDEGTDEQKEDTGRGGTDWQI